jgi:ferrous iron transport protein B
VSVLVWLLSYFPAGGDVTQSYLAWIGRGLAPLGELMGLPWMLMIALLTSFVAKENTIATLGVLYGNFETTLPALITPPAALGFLVVQMLFIPCVATVAAVKQETRSWWWTLLSLGLMLVISLGAGILVYQIGTLWMGG